MNTTLTIRIDEKVKKDAQKFARATGLSLSAIIENRLRDVVVDGKIEFKEYLEPTRESEASMRKVEEDIKSGKIDKLPGYHTGAEIREHFKSIM
jgi:addiction module RelB/DinJ family antitoxin